MGVDVSSRFITSHPGLLEIDFWSWREARGNLQASQKNCYICKSVCRIGRLLKFKFNPESVGTVI